MEIDDLVVHKEYSQDEKLAVLNVSNNLIPGWASMWKVVGRNVHRVVQTVQPTTNIVALVGLGDSDVLLHCAGNIADKTISAFDPISASRERCFGQAVRYKTPPFRIDTYDADPVQYVDCGYEIDADLIVVSRATSVRNEFAARTMAQNLAQMANPNGCCVAVISDDVEAIRKGAASQTAKPPVRVITRSSEPTESYSLESGSNKSKFSGLFGHVTFPKKEFLLEAMESVGFNLEKEMNLSTIIDTDEWITRTPDRRRNHYYVKHLPDFLQLSLFSMNL